MVMLGQALPDSTPPVTLTSAVLKSVKVTVGQLVAPPVRQPDVPASAKEIR
jgi:hypothetical protein